MPTSENVLLFDRIKLNPSNTHGKYMALNRVPNQKLTITSLFSWHQMYSTDRINGSINSCEWREKKIDRVLDNEHWTYWAIAFTDYVPADRRKVRPKCNRTSWTITGSNSRLDFLWNGHFPGATNSCRGNSSSAWNGIRWPDWLDRKIRTSPVSISVNVHQN